MAESRYLSKKGDKILALEERENRIIANREQDEAFQARMLWAIKNKLENPLIGIDKRPCTHSPIFIMRRESRISLNNSPAAQCMAN